MQVLATQARCVSHGCTQRTGITLSSVSQLGTALHTAVEWGCPGHVPLLLAHGADLDLKEKVSHWGYGRLFLLVRGLAVCSYLYPLPLK